MRAGPYRSKWDEARGAVSWLAQDVANAIADDAEAARRSARSPGPTAELVTKRSTAGAAPTDETLEQKVDPPGA